MRTVKIVQQPSRSYPHAAVDLKTGSIVLKHHDDYTLISLCRRLGWTIAAEQTAKDCTRHTKGRSVHH